MGSIEKLSNTTEETFKISELKEKFDIQVSEKEIQDFKDAIFSLKEIKKIQEGKTTVGEVAKESLGVLKEGLSHKVKEVESYLKNSNKIEIQKQKEGKETAKLADETMDKFLEKTTDIKGEVGEALKDGTKKAKEVGKKIKEGGYTVQLGEALSDAFIKLKKFDIWGAIVSLFKGLFGMFTGNEVIKKAGDELKEKLVPKEKREETINKIKQNSDKISEELSQRLFQNEKVHPLVKTKIEQLLGNKDIFTDEILSTLSKKIDSGEEISLEMISEVFKNKNEGKTLWNELIKDKELKEAIYLQFEKNLSNRITEEYGFELNLEKKQELSKIIKKHFNEKTSLVKLGENFWNGDKIYAYETFGAFFDSGKQAMDFQFDLIFSGIIGIGNLAINIFGTGVKMVKLGLSGFGIEGDLTLENFLGEVESMDEGKKAILLGIMYRKTSIAGRIAGGLIGKITEVATEIVSPTSIGFIESTKNMIGNVDSQLSSYQKLHLKLAGVEDDFLNTVKNQLKNVTTKTEIAKILDSSKSPLEIKTALSNINGELFDKDMIKNISSKIENLTDIPTIRDTIATETKFNSKSLSFGEKIKNIYPGQMHYAEELSNKLGYISEWQTQRIKFGGNIEKYTKMPTIIKAAFAQKDISFSTDKLIFNSKDSKKVLELSDHLKKWALESADNFKGMFGGIAEIALVGLAIGTSKEDEGSLETIIKTLGYSTGILGSGAMLLSVNGYRDPETKEIVWGNVGQSVAGSVLLTMDLYESAKILGNGGTMKDVLTKVVARPITAIGSLGVNSYKFGKNGASFSKHFFSEVSKGNINYKKVGIEVGKNISKSKIKILGLLASIGTIGYLINESRYDISDEIAEMQEKGILDKNGNIKNKENARSYLQEEFSDVEKETFVKLYLSQNEFVDIVGNTNIELDGNNINIEIKDKTLGKWIISPEQNKYLEDLGMKINFA